MGRCCSAAALGREARRSKHRKGERGGEVIMGSPRPWSAKVDPRWAAVSLDSYIRNGRHRPANRLIWSFPLPWGNLQSQALLGPIHRMRINCPV